MGNHILAAVLFLKLPKIMPWHPGKMESIKKVRKSEKKHEKDEIDMAFWEITGCGICIMQCQRI